MKQKRWFLLESCFKHLNGNQSYDLIYLLNIFLKMASQKMSKLTKERKPNDSVLISYGAAFCISFRKYNILYVYKKERSRKTGYFHDIVTINVLDGTSAGRHMNSYPTDECMHVYSRIHFHTIVFGHWKRS